MLGQRGRRGRRTGGGGGIGGGSSKGRPGLAALLFAIVAVALAVAVVVAIAIAAAADLLVARRRRRRRPTKGLLLLEDPAALFLLEVGVRRLQMDVGHVRGELSERTLLMRNMYMYIYLPAASIYESSMRSGTCAIRY